MADLSSDVLNLVFLYLPPEELLRIRCVSKQFDHAVRTWRNWVRHCSRVRYKFIQNNADDEKSEWMMRYMAETRAGIPKSEDGVAWTSKSNRKVLRTTPTSFPTPQLSAGVPPPSGKLPVPRRFRSERGQGQKKDEEDFLHYSCHHCGEQDPEQLYLIYLDVARTLDRETKEGRECRGVEFVCKSCNFYTQVLEASAFVEPPSGPCGHAFSAFLRRLEQLEHLQHDWTKEEEKKLKLEQEKKKE